MINRREILKYGALLGASAALPSCVSTRGAARGSSQFTWTIHPAEEVGMSRAGLEGVRTTVQKHIAANELSSAVTAIARHGKPVWHEGQGLRDIDAGVPVRTDDIFRLASSSKPLTAVCVLMLMDEGKLSINDKVSRYLPTFRNQKVAELPPGSEKLLFDFAKRDQLKAQVKLVPANREITLKDLLTHTAGLSTFSGVAGTAPPIDKNKTLADRIPLIGSTPLDFQPGTKWSYSPLDAFDVLLHIVEIVSGMPADQFMRMRLFEPLGMVDTGFHLSPEQQGRLVPYYTRQNEAWKIGMDILGAGDPNMKYLCGAGGLVSTAHDYMQYLEMLRRRGELNGRRILKPETVALMSTNHVGTLFEDIPFLGRKGWGFGLSVGVVMDPVAAGSARGRGSFGWDGAHGTDGWVDPERDMSVVYFVQQSVKPALVDFDRAVAAAVVA